MADGDDVDADCDASDADVGPAAGDDAGGGVTVEDLAEAILDEASFFKLVTGHAPYTYQERMLRDRSRSIVAVCGRQTGKSLAMAVKAMHYTLLHAGKTVIVVSRTEPQAMEFFQKGVLDVFDRVPELEKLVRRQTLKRVDWDNGSRIICIPSKPGSIRVYTPDIVIIDEAAFVDDEMWTAARPSLVKTRGQLIAITTPYGKRGKAYQMYVSGTASAYRVSVEDCPGISGEELETIRTDPSVTDLEWRQEYLAQFVDEAEQWFPHELVLKCQRVPLVEWHEGPRAGWVYYIGVDVARGGRDETVYCILGVHAGDAERPGDELPRVVAYYKHAKKSITHTAGRAKELVDLYGARAVGVDAMGVGAGVYDILEEDGYPVLDCAFSGRFKDRVYKRMKMFMDQGRLGLLHEDNVPEEHAGTVRRATMQFLDLGYEYTRDGLLRVGADVSRTNRLGGRRLLDDFPDATIIAFDVWDGGSFGFTEFYEDMVPDGTSKAPGEELPDFLVHLAGT